MIPIPSVTITPIPAESSFGNKESIFAQNSLISFGTFSISCGNAFATPIASEINILIPASTILGRLLMIPCAKLSSTSAAFGIICGAFAEIAFAIFKIMLSASCPSDGSRDIIPCASVIKICPPADSICGRFVFKLVINAWMTCTAVVIIFGNACAMPVRRLANTWLPACISPSTPCVWNAFAI